MTLLHILIPTVSPQVPRSRGIRVTYNLVECSAVPRVKLRIYLRTNIFGASYEADTLQNNRLKNDHLLIVPLLTLHAVNIRC